MLDHPPHDELDHDRYPDDGYDADGYDADGYDDGWYDSDELVTVRPAAYRAIRAVVALAVLAAISFGLVVGVRSWFYSQLNSRGAQGEEISVTVPAGATTANIATLLEENKVIPNSVFFRYYVDFKGAGNFQAGRYLVKTNSSAAQAVAVLQAGPVPPATKTFQVREGLWLSEMLPRIAEQTGVPLDQLQAVLDQNQIQPRYRPEGNTSWEGLLFPSTYQVDQDASALDVLTKMSNEFAKVTGQLGYGAAETKVKHSAYEVIIVASMVEAEAKTDADRPKVARVIYNRLQKQGSLDIDATCIFEAQDRKVQLTDKFMRSGSPYDCRNNINLPPTPISFPSKASLAAAINPADGDWYYYVVKDAQGNQFFTNSYDEFIKQKNLSKSQGLF